MAMTAPAEQQLQEPYEQRVKGAFVFWGGLLSDRSPGAYVVVDPSNPGLDDIDQEHMDLDTAHYEASDKFDLPDDHKFAKAIIHELAGKLLKHPEDFQKIVEMFQEQKDLMEQLRAMVDHPEEKHENILVLANHPWFMNIAILEGALFCAVDRPGFNKHLAITISKTLGFMQAITEQPDEGEEDLGPQTIPVIMGLQVMGDVFTTVPSSDSTDRPELIILRDFASKYGGNGYNTLMLRPYARKARGGKGFVSIIAGSASLDKVDDNDPNTIVMKPIDEVAAKLFARTASKVLAVATYKDTQGNVTAKIVHLGDLQSEDDVHNAMQMIAPSYANLVGDGVNVIYDDPRLRPKLEEVSQFDDTPEATL